jgi:hypothetical protein
MTAWLEREGSVISNERINHYTAELDCHEKTIMVTWEDLHAMISEIRQHRAGTSYPLIVPAFNKEGRVDGYVVNHDKCGGLKNPRPVAKRTGKRGKR